MDFLDLPLSFYNFDYSVDHDTFVDSLAQSSGTTDCNDDQGAFQSVLFSTHHNNTYDDLMIPASVQTKSPWSDFSATISPALLEPTNPWADMSAEELQDQDPESPVIASTPIFSYEEDNSSQSQSPSFSTPELSFSAMSSDHEDADDTTDDDEEYRPSPEPTNRKRRRSPSFTNSCASSTFRSSDQAPQERPTKRLRGPPPSRNQQASADEANAIKRMVQSNNLEKANFVCPFKRCGYRQTNRRMPDFKRHVETHMRSDRVRCIGVPVEEASQHPKIPSNAKPYSLDDKDGMWVGGCLRTFSRADALKRHVDNSRGVCAGCPGRL